MRLIAAKNIPGGADEVDRLRKLPRPSTVAVIVSLSPSCVGLSTGHNQRIAGMAAGTGEVCRRRFQACLAESSRECRQPSRHFFGCTAWRAALHDCPKVLEQLDRLPARINRDDVCRVVTENLDRGDALSVFVPAMIWGYGDVGYGPDRVRWVMTGIKGKSAYSSAVDPDVAARLEDAVRVVRGDGPVAGFRHMNNASRIKHLGPAFFTKSLYFASVTSGLDDANAAPILDKRVKEWLAAHADVILDINKTIDYQRYVNLLNDWGAQCGWNAVQVEKAIFGLSTGR